MANEVATKQTFSEQLSTALADVKDALPQGFNQTRFVQNAIALLNGNENLAKFSKEYGTAQIKTGLLQGAYLGLDFMSSEAYLVPYGSKLQFMKSYRGDIKLCKKYSIRPIKDIYAKIVREGDFFEETIEMGKPGIDFKPKPFNDGEILGAFAVCLFQDGGMIYETMSLKELETCRKQSKAQNSPAWANFTSEMYKKTVIHRLCKLVELDFDTVQQAELFDDDVAIETDTKEIVANDIETNANTEEFVVEIAESENPFEGGEA